MLSRVMRVFRRYADERLQLAAPATDLMDTDGTVMGRLERIAMRRNRLQLSGTGKMRQIGASYGRAPYWTGAEQGRFDLDIPFETGPFDIHLERDGRHAVQTLPGFSPRALRWKRRALWGRYLFDLCALTPQIWRWKRHGDMVAREAVKERLGIVPRTQASELRPGLFPDSPPDIPSARPATLVMPVYNAFDVLCEALGRVACHSGENWRMVLIEDRSSDPRVWPFVENWAAAQGDHVTLLRNPENLGFIGSVNRGFKVARAWETDPVVLLNSDALVPQGWLDRLLAPLAAPDVASVTPMSNDAEIFTVPVHCLRSALAPGAVDQLDRVAAGFDPGASLGEAPTGVGFCMALSPRFLAQIPSFDTGFGRGYGEETDWCQKARRLGGRHVCAGNLFVEHCGGESFGSAAKQKLLERNGRIISQRYPDYDQEVQDFIRRDPLSTSRLALALAWAADRQTGPVPVYLAHAMGGGAEHYLQERIAADIEAGNSAAVLRVGQGRRWKLELHCAPGVIEGLTDDTDLVAALVALLPRRRIVYSCGVGDRDAAALPGILLRLAGRGDAAAGPPQPIEVLMHDFFPISPSCTLLGADGRFRGVPLPGTEAGCDPAHSFRTAGGRVTGIVDWQRDWGALLAAAERITVFSDNSRDLLNQVYPGLKDRLQVCPHPLSAPPPRLTPGWDGDGMPTIGVLGNIGMHKGAGVLDRFSRDLARSGAARLVVLGHLAPEAQLAPPSLVHGAYQLRDLPDLVARYRIAGWFMPSVWPETFSFTTHEMLATGLPVMSFDLGAQGAAVSRAVAKGAPGAVIPLHPATDGGDLARLILPHLRPFNAEAAP